MKGALFSLLAVWGLSSAAGPVYFQLASHNEAPSIPDTPNFTNLTAQADYIRWRNALKELGEMCVARGIAYNCQCEWNFLEGVRKWEINPGTAVPGLTTNTQNKNILLYLYDLGQSNGVPIEIDPHSHEGSGYTYADVAWLVSQCVTTAPVVGGHVWNGATETATDFVRLSASTGVAPSKFPAVPNWFPRLLMGGATTSHVNDPHASGLWRPASASNFHAHATNGSIAAIGHWQNDLFENERFLRLLESGELPEDGQFWTAGLVLNHRDFQDGTYRSNTVRAVLDTLKAWQDAGRIRTTTFMGALGLWQTNFAAAGHVYERPPDNASFSLNWQDFHYTNETVRYLHDLLTLHEERQVPVDVFFTTWQTDLIEQFPDLLGRLQSSALVAMNYHIRPPKPYANNFLWGPITSPTNDKAATILNYETHGLNLVTGMPTTNDGGYPRLATLMDYPPVCVGAIAPTSVVSYVNTVFSNLGARMFVRHAPPVNVSSRETGTKLFYRPEHWDWKLIALFETNATDPQPSSFTQAIAWAHATTTNGGSAPWFVGVKLHDNDLFAEQSQWTLVYSNTASRPWNLSVFSTALTASVQSDRFAFYSNLVVTADALRTNLNLVNTFDTVAFMGDEQNRPVGLTRTAFREGQTAGSELARIRGGGTIPGQAVDYELVAGDGADDNADFAIVSNRLLAATALNYETGPVRHLRVRWNWRDGLDSSNILATGERALTVVMLNIDTDDDDGDGMTEAEEAIAGTDPQDPASVLRVASLAGPTGTNTGSVAVLTATNRWYTLESSTNLILWQAEVGATNVPGTGALQNLGGSAPVPDRMYFRIRAER